MRRQALTDTAIRALKPPSKGSRILWDKLPGFGCRISQAGTRAFVVLVASGRTQTIGRYPLLSLSAARTEAKHRLAAKTLGKLYTRRTAFLDAQADFLAVCESRAIRGDLRPRTVKEYRRYLSLFPFNRQSIADITPRDILKHLHKLDNRPGEKEHSFRVLRTLFRYCVREHLIDRSPMETMACPPLSRPRERVLTEDELKAVWNAARAGESSFHRIVALLILTGARRGEITKLQWDWIDTELKTITFPGTITKNGRTHSIPYGNLTDLHLRSTPHIHGSPYIFPAARQRSERTTTFNGWGKPKAAFDKECSVTGWTLHDCRRVYASGMQRLGVRLEVTEALLNHVSGTQSGIVGVYQRHHWSEEKREAVLRWEAYLDSLI